jgi:hypothetical protein
MGDKLLLKLNIYGKPIANKYCEGKMKRTLKRGLKDLKSLKRKRLKKCIDMAFVVSIPVSLLSVLNRLAGEAAMVLCGFFISKGKMGSCCGKSLWRSLLREAPVDCHNAV